MSLTQTIDYQLNCFRCGYDLFTLSVDGVCPECGALVTLTLCSFASRAKKDFVDSEPSPMRSRRAAGQLGVPADAVLFLRIAFEFALKIHREKRLRFSASREVVTARELCLAVRDLASLEFGQLASQRLRDWGIATRDGVAALTRGLVEQGVLGGKDDECNEFFNSDCPDPVGPTV